MKFKTTAKAIRQSGGRILCLGYCEAQHLLNGVQPVAYTCGVYGWNFDVYDVDGFTICTGYRGMPGKRPTCDVREYEKRAESILYDYSIPWDERSKTLESLRRDWLQSEAVAYVDR